MMNHGVVHFEIPASDPDKLSNFYSQLFGWRIEKMSMEGGDYWTTATVETDEQGMPKQPGAINGGIFTRQSPDQRPMNYVNVESIEQYVDKAKSLGASVTMDKMPIPGMGFYAQLSDPDGNPFGVFQVSTSAA
jgi:predicted enzyme related to lactoylglutathione lyase